jgi:hypothetical protein
VSSDENVASKGCNAEYPAGYVKDGFARVLYWEELGWRLDL